MDAFPFCLPRRGSSLIVVIYVTAFRGTLSKKLFSQPLLTSIGGMCYTIYLYHWMAMSFTAKFTQRFHLGDNFLVYFALQCAMVLPVILLISTFVFVLIERPCMDKRWPWKLWAWASRRQRMLSPPECGRGAAVTMRLSVGLILFAAHAYAASFHFAIIGDRTGRAVPGVYEEAWREAAASHPDFALTVGDAIEGGDDTAARAEWEGVKPAWMRKAPVYHTPGNHDIWSQASEAVYVRETGCRPSYSFDFRGAHFVVLDNSRTENLSSAQLQFLESDLKNSRATGPILVFFHRPFWLVPLKLRAADFALQRIAKKYGICCVISGHGHQLQSAMQDGVLYLEIGSSGASLSGAGRAGIGYDEGWFYQYAEVTVEGRSVAFEVRELIQPYGEGRKQMFHASAR